MLLDSKTAIVTGGAAGFGRAVCERLKQNPAGINDVVASSVLRRFMEPADINVDGATMWD